MSAPRVTIDAFDADGCLYNGVYFQVLLYFMEKYSDEIDHLINTHDKAARYEVLERIKKEIRDFDLQTLLDANMDDIQNKFLQKGREVYTRLRGKMRVKLMAQQDRNHIHDYQLIKQALDEYFPDLNNDDEILDEFMLYYIAQVYRLDADIMGEILLISNPAVRAYFKESCAPGMLRYIAQNSLRQTMGIDNFNMVNNVTGSIFLDLYHMVRRQRLALKQEGVDVRLQPLTITDIQFKREAGDCFRRIVTRHQGAHDDGVVDSSKVANAYMLLHQGARQHRNAEITLTIFDNEEGIVDGLIGVYDKYRKLIPQGTTLVIQQYDGIMQKRMVIPGEGPLDENVERNVLLMLDMARDDAAESAGTVNVAKNVDMEEFLARRNLVMKQRSHKKSESETLRPFKLVDLAARSQFDALTGKLQQSKMRTMSSPCLFAARAEIKSLLRNSDAVSGQDKKSGVAP
jgi:hypothetical protein